MKAQRFILHAGDDSWTRILANVWTLLNGLSKTKSWAIEIKRHVKSRSSDQNSAMWGLAYPLIADAIGEDVNTIHEYMLGEYFGWVETCVLGRKKLKPARTTTSGLNGESDVLDKLQFAAYFDFIQRRAAEHGIHIPDPDPFWREAKAA
jgi:hypothetical protein